MILGKQRDTKRKMYIRIFITMILSIVLTLLIATSVLYVNFQNAAADQIYLANMESLNKLDSEVSLMSKTALNLSNQIYRDYTVSKLLYYSPPDIFDISLALDQLNNYRLSIPFIDSIYVYNGFSDNIYVESSDSIPLQSSVKTFYDKQVVSIIDNYKKHLPYEPIPRTYKDPTGKEKYLYTFLMYDYVAGGPVLSNGVFVNISQEWISDVINDTEDAQGSNTFIINGSGTVVSQNSTFHMMENYAGKNYIGRILNTKKPGYFSDTVDGVKSIVVYTDPDIYGWRFVRIIPWSTVFKKVENIRTITILISFGILLLGVLVSFVISGRLFNPIQKMISNMESMENEKDKNTRALRQEFLRNLAEGRNISSRDELMKEYSKLGVSLDFNAGICALLFKIDNYNVFMQDNNIEDRNLLKFAIINISCEILSDVCRNEGIDMGRDSILVILSLSGHEEGDLKESLSGKLEIIKALLKEHYNLSVSASISKKGSSVEELNHLYSEVQELSLYRLYFGHGCTIFADRADNFKTRDYSYPVQKEKLLIEALMAGKRQETRKIYDDIVGETLEYPITVFNLMISHMIFSLNNTIKIIKGNYSLPNLDVTTPSIYLNNLETIDEINMQFYDIFNRIADGMEEKKSSKHEELVIKIDNHINTDYPKLDLSTDLIARALGVSVPHLCRVYKQNTLHTIQERITEVRMNKAKELLLNTDYPIGDITEKVGYSNSNYFYKAFKAANGMTPKEFRSNGKR